ncbi:MAG: hypothetical protein BWY06_02938 [Candidatus Latescibacteria bacterium ADurb.Bin168]|nr:MAG: hypothetical protein BWY06_02938 [Candidatus Latescibacteria bacterium ADurb.Bin168]
MSVRHDVRGVAPAQRVRRSKTDDHRTAMRATSGIASGATSNTKCVRRPQNTVERPSCKAHPGLQGKNRPEDPATGERLRTQFSRLSQSQYYGRTRTKQSACRISLPFSDALLKGIQAAMPFRQKPAECLKMRILYAASQVRETGAKNARKNAVPRRTALHFGCRIVSK